MGRDQRIHLLLKELGHLDIEVRLDDGHLQINGDKLTVELCDEIDELKPELVEYLSTHGEEIVDDPEERAHSDRNTLPRTPEEAERQRADADRVRERARRRYQNGAVLVNDRNNMGQYMRQLRQQREAAEAVERGDAPPAGRYRTRFDIFG